MVDLGEHIEEIARIYDQEKTPYDGEAIANDALDIACAQGLITFEEADTEDTKREVRDQVLYLLGV